MNTEDALAFLREHQPMPADDDLSEELIGKYDEVRSHFVENPDARAIPLFLTSFGEGDGLGVYQLVEDVISRFPTAMVLPYVKEGLSSPRRSVRYWNAEIAATMPSPELAPTLGELLSDEDADVRSAAAIALGQIKSETSIEALKEHLKRERDHHVRDLITRLLYG